MKYKQPVKDYISRSIRQLRHLTTEETILLVVFAAVTFFLYPNTTGLYLIILVLVLIGGYRAFADLFKDLADLEVQVGELRKHFPNIAVSLQDRTHDLFPQSGVRHQSSFPSLIVNFNRIPPRPNLDRLLSEEREQLQEKKRRFQQTRQQDGIGVIFDTTNRINSFFDKEVEAYLVKYRYYQEQLYFRSVARQRALFLSPVVVNQGRITANNVAVEISLPAGYKQPTEERCRDIRSALANGKHALQPPREPKITWGVFDSSVGDWDDESLRIPRWDRTLQTHSFSKSNTSGPDIKRRNGTYVIIYSVQELAPKQPEDNFNPFLLWLPDLSKTTSWNLPVRIYFNELTYPQQANLKIDLVVKN